MTVIKNKITEILDARYWILPPEADKRYWIPDKKSGHDGVRLPSEPISGLTAPNTGEICGLIMRISAIIAGSK
jgi:hypothetical protein